MQLGATLAPQLLTATDPPSRGAPESLRPGDRPPDGAPAAAPFDLLLQLLGNSLPARLPTGETLPVEADVVPGQDAADADAAVPTPDPAAGTSYALALAAALLVPSAPSAAPAPVFPGELLAGASGAPKSPADALRAAFAGAPRAPAAAPAVAPAADATAAAPVPATDPGTPAAPSIVRPGQPELAVAQADRPAELDMLLALGSAARAAAPAPAAQAAGLRTPDDYRTRAPSVTPAARALSLATELARADAASAARGDAPVPRAFDFQAPAAVADAPVLLRTARLDEPLLAGLTAPAADAGAALTNALPASAHAANGAQPAASAPPAASLPPHLGTPVDAQSARWHEALASRIHWLVDHEIGEAQIKLNPPELGALDVKISMRDDKTFVQMTAHTSAARDELSQSLPRLRELMSAGGLDLGGATVSGGRDDRSGYGAAAPPVTRADAFASDSTDVAADLSPRVRLGSSSRIDIFA